MARHPVPTANCARPTVQNASSVQSHPSRPAHHLPFLSPCPVPGADSHQPATAWFAAQPRTTMGAKITPTFSATSDAWRHSCLVFPRIVQISDTSRRSQTRQRKLSSGLLGDAGRVEEVSGEVQGESEEGHASGLCGVGADEHEGIAHVAEDGA
ncbi:hypothetical protein CORC01_12535 [Colletotrichum orchidophilum]|uniref:Uncharacterized protein n=1 Tax=Colletotrichum orchidophilum TaxID=1209926 RepID=A0A1G4ASP6_9PEZI|nr:uncharacterized protein CORC01_12535 [Colletotrichum orchidophilum]OHE92190.1 hypothetical protein CORC01_12535 [Colletotrichum orchidophilum]